MKETQRFFPITGAKSGEGDISNEHTTRVSKPLGSEIEVDEAGSKSEERGRVIMKETLKVFPNNRRPIGRGRHLKRARESDKETFRV